MGTEGPGCAATATALHLGALDGADTIGVVVPSEGSELLGAVDRIVRRQNGGSPGFVRGHLTPSLLAVRFVGRVAAIG